MFIAFRANYLRTIKSTILILSIFFAISSPTDAQIVSPEVYTKLESSSLIRVIVALKPDTNRFSTLKSKIDTIRSNKIRVLSKLSSSQFIVKYNWVTVNAFSGYSSIDGIQLLSNDPDVLKIDLDISGQGGLFQSVPLINADDVVDTGFTGQGITVAVLDTGVDADNSNLEDDISAEHCFCEDDDGSGCCPNGAVEQGGSGSAADDNGHGTNISGIITSEGNIPVAQGVAPGAKIVAVKVLDSENSFATVSQIISGLEWVLLNRPEVDIVNMSLGTNTLYEDVCDNESAFSMALFDAVQNLVDSGVVVFASSQNDGSINSIALPACLSNTISVGAVYDGDNGNVDIFGCEDSSTKADQVACFSNSSPFLDLLAPGSRITSTGLGLGGISTQSGSSQASAHASATAALLLDAIPDLSPEEIKNTLMQTGVTVVDDRNGLVFPRIDALAALNFVADLNIEDKDNGISLCSMAGSVSQTQFLFIFMTYMLPILFILFRHMARRLFYSRINRTMVNPE